MLCRCGGGGSYKNERRAHDNDKKRVTIAKVIGHLLVGWAVSCISPSSSLSSSSLLGIISFLFVIIAVVAVWMMSGLSILCCVWWTTVLVSSLALTLDTCPTWWWRWWCCSWCRKWCMAVSFSPLASFCFFWHWCNDDCSPTEATVHNDPCPIVGYTLS